MDHKYPLIDLYTCILFKNPKSFLVKGLDLYFFTEYLTQKFKMFYYFLSGPVKTQRGQFENEQGQPVKKDLGLRKVM